MTQTVIISGDYSRVQARRIVDNAPAGAVVTVDAARRTNDQNSLLWAMLSEISRAKPDGRVMPPETWKALFMNAAGFQCTFEPSLDGKGVVPLGFKSSRLRKAEFSDLIECIHAFAAEHGIALSDEPATGIDAASAGETRSGSTEGESPARRGRPDTMGTTA